MCSGKRCLTVFLLNSFIHCIQYSTVCVARKGCSHLFKFFYTKHIYCEKRVSDAPMHNTCIHKTFIIKNTLLYKH